MLAQAASGSAWPLILATLVGVVLGTLLGYARGRRSALAPPRPYWLLGGGRTVSDRIWNDPRFWSEPAEQAFDKALSRAEREKRATHECLLSFDDVVAGRTLVPYDKGFDTISISAIVGSVGKACWFTRSFDPKREDLRERWKRMYAMAHGLVGYERIDLYRVGEEYFVLDGHFRVSVIRILGGDSVRAHVQEWS